MHTGDLATIDDEGYCNIVGRIKDMVIRGGENVYPREIEEFLYRHPKVQDVQVVGVPDVKYGEELCAWIKLREGAPSHGERSARSAAARSPTTRSRAYIRFVDGFPDDRHRQDPEVRDAHHLEIAALGGAHQGCHALIIDGVEIELHGQEGPDVGQIIARDGVEQDMGCFGILLARFRFQT
jgi:hypothetical protein